VFGLLALPPLLLLIGSSRVRSLPPPQGEAARAPLGVTLLVSLMTGLYVVGELIVSTRLPLLIEREGRSELWGDAALSAFFLCLLASRLGFGLARVPLSNRLMLALCLVGSALITALGVLVEPLVLPLAALTMGPFFPTAVDLLAEEIPDALEGALGILFAVVSLLVALAHIGVGVLSDAVGLRWALAVCPTALVLALLVLALLSRSGTRGSPARSSACGEPPRSGG
jgi:fucose permease